MNSICISITALSSVLLFHTKYFINQSIDPSSLRAKHQQRRKSELKADMFKHWNCKSLQTSSYQDHHFAVFSFLLIYLLQHFLHPRQWTVSVHTQYNDCHKIQWNRSPTIYNLQAHLHPLRISPEFHFCETVIPPSSPLKFPNIYPKIPRVFTTADHESRFGCQSLRFLLQWHQSRYLVVASHDTECLRLILTLLSIPMISDFCSLFISIQLHDADQNVLCDAVTSHDGE